MHTNTRLDTRRKSVNWAGVGQPVWTYVLLFLLVPTLLCSCSLLPKISLKPVPTPSEQPIFASYRPHLRMDVWLQDTFDFPRKDFNEAKQAVADAIDKLVQPDSDGNEVHIGLITSNSYDPASTVLSFTIPPIPADPQPPLLQPTPTLTSNGDIYSHAQEVNQVAAENAQTEAEYQNRMRLNHQLLARMQSYVRQFTNRIRALNPPVDPGPTDLWGMFSRAAMRLQGGRGPKYLIIASSLENSTWQEFIPGNALWGTKVRVIWHYCQDAPACAANDAFWRGAFLHAGATNVRIFDPAQSQTLQNLFV